MTAESHESSKLSNPIHSNTTHDEEIHKSLADLTISSHISWHTSAEVKRRFLLCFKVRGRPNDLVRDIIASIGGSEESRKALLTSL